jgi:hypothetical protein
LAMIVSKPICGFSFAAKYRFYAKLPKLSSRAKQHL